MTRWPEMPADVAPVPGRMKGEMMDISYRGFWCLQSEFLDRNGVCRNPDGCTCAEISRLTAELEAARAEITRLCDRVIEVASERTAAEALLPRAYEAGRDDAAEVKVLRFEEGGHRAKVPLQPETQAAIRALPLPSPADLAARLGGAE